MKVIVVSELIDYGTTDPLAAFESRHQADKYIEKLTKENGTRYFTTDTVELNPDV